MKRTRVITAESENSKLKIILKGDFDFSSSFHPSVEGNRFFEELTSDLVSILLKRCYASDIKMKALRGEKV